MRKIVKSKTGISLPKVVMDDLDYLAFVTRASRSAVLAAVVGDIVHEAVRGLRESERLSHESPDGCSKLTGITSDVVKAIFAYKSASVGGLELDFSSLSDSHAE